MPQMSFTRNEDIKILPSFQLPKFSYFWHTSLIKPLLLKESDKTSIKLECNRLVATGTILRNKCI